MCRINHTLKVMVLIYKLTVLGVHLSLQTTVDRDVLSCGQSYKFHQFITIFYIKSETINNLARHPQ